MNKLDEIDEEEEKPENIIANAAKLFKDKVTKVIGVSAKCALDGKLQGKQELLQASNFNQVEMLLTNEVTAARNSY